VGVDTPARPHVLRALRHRNYRLFFGGQLVSLIGTWMQSVAQSWLVFRLTHSPVLLGLVGFASQFPVFVLAPLGGLVADRHRRHRLLVLTQSASMVLAFALAALTLTGRVREGHVFVLAALVGVVNAFDVPIRQAFVVEMVGREDLVNAIALNSSMVNGARVVGPAVAGVLVAALGEGWCFFANGISYLAVIAALMMMEVPRRPPPARESSALAHLAEGFRFVARTPPIRALLVLLGIVSFTGMPYAVLMPIFADDVYHAGARGLGLLMGASGVGALMGSIALARRTGVTGLGRWVAAAGVSFAVSLILFALAPGFALAVALLVPVGASMIVQMAASNTLIQSMVPDALRGRVMGVYSMMFLGMAPLGALLAGALAGPLGARGTVAAGGAICLLASAVFARCLPSLRPHARRLILAQQAAGGDPAEEATGTYVSVEDEEAAEGR